MRKLTIKCIKKGTQRTLLIISTPATDISGGRCWYFRRPLKIRNRPSLSLPQRHLHPVCESLFPCKWRPNNRKTTSFPRYQRMIAILEFGRWPHRGTVPVWALLITRGQPFPDWHATFAQPTRNFHPTDAQLSPNWRATFIQLTRNFHSTDAQRHFNPPAKG